MTPSDLRRAARLLTYYANVLMHLDLTPKERKFETEARELTRALYKEARKP